jgi:hypothetical protein
LWAEFGDEYHSAGKYLLKGNWQRTLAVGNALSFGKGAVCAFEGEVFGNAW